MKIGLYQMNVTNNISENFDKIKQGIINAKEKNIELLCFPECSLTGYVSIEKVNKRVVDDYITNLHNLAIANNMHLIIGSITKQGDNYFNSAILIYPCSKTLPAHYNKRALIGEDECFTPGTEWETFRIRDFNFGIRICYEIRFPEYFRELYNHVDFIIMMYADTANINNEKRYELLKSHLKVRASENVVNILAVNTCNSFQTAPTCVVDENGNILLEAKKNEEELILYDYNHKELDHSAKGRKRIGNQLTGFE